MFVAEEGGEAAPGRSAGAPDDERPPATRVTLDEVEAALDDVAAALARMG